MPIGRRIKINPNDILCNPRNVTEMPKTKVDEEHKKRLAKDPTYEPGKTVKSYLFHDNISYEDELESLWGKKWGAQGIGKLKEIMLGTPTEAETRDEFYKDPAAFGEQWCMPKPNLEKWKAQFDNLVKTYSENGVTVNILETPVPILGPYGYTRWFWATTDAAIVINGGSNNT